MMVQQLFEQIDFKYISGTFNEEHNKPDPYRLNQIITKEGINKDKVLYFGDMLADIRAAENAGVDMILVTYGYANRQAYDDSYPLKLIDSPYEILNL